MNMDPKEMSARFDSVCKTCGGKIEKGSSIVYWPLHKKAGHYNCEEKSFLESLSAIADEGVNHGTDNPYCN